MLKTILLSIVLFSFFKSEAQINVQWESRYNNPSGNGIDNVSDFELDNFGNTYVTGTSNNGTDFDIITVKYDNTGLQLWINTYGGSGLDEATALAIDGNGDIIVTGSRYVSGSDWDAFILKIDGDNGSEIWSTIANNSSDYDIGNDVAINASNDIYIVGTKSTGSNGLNYFVKKFNGTNGTELADQSGANGPNTDQGLFIALDASSDVYIAGTRDQGTSSTFFDFRIMKISSDLSSRTWTTYEDSGFNNNDKPNCMTIDDSGNIYVAGQGFNNSIEGDDYLLMKLDNTGTLQWTKTYSGDDGNTDKINAIVVDGSGHVFVTGKSKSIATAEDYYTIAYDQNGNELWAQRFSTNGLGLDEATDIQLSASNNLYVTGYSYLSSSNNDYYTIKYDINGNEQWNTRFNGPAGNSDKASNMRIDAGENIYITGASHGGNSTNLDYSTIRYCQLETIAPADVAICTGQSTNLVASSVGNIGSNFNWSVVSGDPINIGTNFSCNNCPNPTATPTVTTIYAVSSTSPSGCVDFDTVTVTVNSIPSPTVYNNGPLAFCIGDSVELYTDPYNSYTWSNGSTNISTYALNQGTYTVTITDANGCQNSASTSVTNFTLPNVDAGIAQTICPENTAQLTATGATSFTWTIDPTLSQLLIPNPIANPSSYTKYYVTGVDGNNCSNIDSVTISLHTSPTIDAGTPITICVNDSTQLLATGAVSYQWNSLTSIPIQNIDNPWVYPIAQTKYIVTGTDLNGCTSKDSVTISTNNLPFISAGVNHTICEGDSAHIFATGALSYLWQSTPTLSDLTSSNPWAKPTTQTDYIVEGTDINTCKTTDTVTVFVNAAPSVSAGSNTTICIGSSTQLNASGAISYLWTPDPTLTTNNIFNPTVNPTSPTTYFVVGTDANGCKNNSSVDVNINALPIVSAGSDTFICVNDSLQLSASGADTYVWSYHPTLSQLIGPSPWANPTANTTYNVQGTDANGCVNTAQINIGINSIPLAPSITQDSIYLISDSLTGNQWFLDGSELTGENNDSLTYINYTNVNYTIVFTDLNGCSSDSEAINATITVENVSIHETAQPLKLTIFPNPTINNINIKSDQEIISIFITDINGQLIHQDNNILSKTFMVDFSELNAGIYFVKVNSEQGYSLKKVIKH